jgi:hypothetical protein
MSQNDANPMNPVASRPDLPEYGLLDAGQGRGLLPWQWAQERLEHARRYWVSSTRPDGRPHAAPVWGIWWKNTFYFSTGRLTRKARNFAKNPHCVICIEDAEQAVIVEGTGGLVSETPVLRQLARIYRRKYGLGFPADANVYAVRPAVVFGFIDGEEFSGSATRWHF